MSENEVVTKEPEHLKREIQELKTRLNQESGQTSAANQSLLQRVTALELRLAH
ncbi:hypothetical protein HBO15_26540 [Pseudomonas sp. WS 5111]|uniref:hypothetical protein n=1 Tax=Pseudomonas sp. WS 5111 TaxID=2717493 RepID=UPI001472A0B9|nr:hypothetical protein [Pseudomonas sp. WS 5111]NMX70916.1 hypothetical protein [Pseudomonas sp. WS 5111]